MALFFNPVACSTCPNLSRTAVIAASIVFPLGWFGALLRPVWILFHCQ
jgi:hypothetical protein